MDSHPTIGTVNAIPMNPHVNSYGYPNSHSSFNHSSPRHWSDARRNVHSCCQSCTVEQQKSRWSDLRQEEHSCCRSCTRSLQNSQDNFFEVLSGAIIAFAAFGGSITFTCIVEISENGPSHGRITYKRARTFMSIAWFLFTMDFCFAAMFTAAAYLCRRSVSSDIWEASNFQYANLVATFILPELSVAALVFAGVAVSAYAETVGYTASGIFIGLFAAVFIGWVCLCR